MIGGQTVGISRQAVIAHRDFPLGEKASAGNIRICRKAGAATEAPVMGGFQDHVLNAPADAIRISRAWRPPSPQSYEAFFWASSFRQPPSQIPQLRGGNIGRFDFSLKPDGLWSDEAGQVGGSAAALRSGIRARRPRAISMPCQTAMPIRPTTKSRARRTSEKAIATDGPRPNSPAPRT